MSLILLASLVRTEQGLSIQDQVLDRGLQQTPASLPTSEADADHSRFLPLPRLRLVALASLVSPFTQEGYLTPYLAGVKHILKATKIRPAAVSLSSASAGSLRGMTVCGTCDDVGLVGY
jgi:hypothetical protein